LEEKMSEPRKSYTSEFKLEVLELLKTSGKSQLELEHELGLGKGNISRWQKEFAQGGQQAFPGKGHQTPDEERLRKLERENAILRQERDILKKVLGIISRDEE
jgi:transposase